MSHSDKATGRILIVDDSATVAMVVKNAVKSVVDIPVDLARSFAACRKLLEDFPG